MSERNVFVKSSAWIEKCVNSLEEIIICMIISMYKNNYKSF